MTQGVHSGPGDLAPGDQIAGYEILDQIGRGGMAVVYRALDLRLGRTAALKVLAPELGEDQAFRQRFIRESRAAAGVDHPHIIPVYEAGESAGVLFIAMRYVGGGDVRLLIEAEGRLSPSRVAEITGQAASALDAAHAHGLVHRDVKPGNMLLGQASSSGHDHMYLSDFGLSKDSLNPQTLTSTGQFFGTLDYVSPEQIQGLPVDGRADQYALACTVVEMLTGAPPFERTDTMALMWAQLHAAPPRLTDRRPELPPVVDQVIARALAKSAASRYPSCSAFAEALTAAFAEARDVAPPTARSSPVPPVPADEPWPRRPRGWPNDDRLEPDSMADATRTAGPGWEGRSAAGGGRPVPPRISRSPAAEPELAQNFLTPGPPGTDPWPRQPQSAGPAAYRQGTWPQQPSRTSPGRGGPVRHTGRTVAITLFVALCVASVTGAVLYRLTHRTDASTPPPAATTTITVPPTSDAGRIVREFYALINQQRYYAAWQLTPETQSYQGFASGYAGTERDVLRIQKVSGDVVTVQLTSLQTDGRPTKYFAGTYTVTNGKISGADIQQVG